MCGFLGREMNASDENYIVINICPGEKNKPNASPPVAFILQIQEVQHHP